jgi:hypothetical protein
MQAAGGKGFSPQPPLAPMSRVLQGVAGGIRR